MRSELQNGPEAFADYVARLEDLARRALSAPGTVPSAALAAALDGEPQLAFRRAVPVAVRKASGAFLTSASLARRAIRNRPDSGTAAAVVSDPACGAGDLLLPSLPDPPGRRDTQAVLELFGRVARGADIDETLVRATRARLGIAAARAAGPNRSPVQVDLAEAFSRIRVGNALAPVSLEGDVQRVVMNPPFITIKAPPGLGWASGGVSAAALFVISYLEAASGGTRFSAILPDVLRSGSRYRRWREAVESVADIESIDLVGSFDPEVDVDVFVLHATRRQRVASTSRVAWTPPTASTGGTVGDHFDISVGAVVPHRHPNKGPWRPFLQAVDAEAGGYCRLGLRHRRFRGTVVRPPFVVVRRTSSPSDKVRVVATRVGGDKQIAVENHLIVLCPKRGGADECRRLMRVLKSDETNGWVNQRIRCRHLTVEAIREIPWAANK